MTFNTGTGVLSGTPESWTGGTYSLTFTAANGVSPNATQSFTLTVDSSPAIISDNQTNFLVGTSGSFTVTASGTPTPTFSESGTFPSGVSFNTSTGVLSGTPASGTSGTYSITFTAGNGIGSNNTQNFILTVQPNPAITSTNNITFSIGNSGSFTVTAIGSPTPTLSESGTLPSGVSFSTSTGVLSGTPASGTSGTYPLTLTASNGNNNSQSFTLTVATAGTVFYYLDDALGTSRVVTTATGTVCYDADFYPFGGERAYTDTCDAAYKFTGKERDSESGLDYFGARHNSSQYGRFMTPDPSGGHLSDPQTLNKYAYVLNNPINFIDPIGLDCYDGGDPSEGIEACADEVNGGFGLGFDPVSGCGGEAGLCGFGGSGFNSGGFGNGGNCPASMSTCGAFGPGNPGDYNSTADMASSPFEFQFFGTVCLSNCSATLALFDTWGGYTDWATNVAAQAQRLQNIFSGYGPQRAWVISGLQQADATGQAVNKFIMRNPDGTYANLEGGNFDFFDPGLAGLCPNNLRCNNGLDFSHGDGTFHRDTANPFNFPFGTMVHFAVDFVFGNIVDVIPR